MGNIVELMTLSDANFVNNKSVWFIHPQFLDVFGKTFIALLWAGKHCNDLG